MGAVESDGCTGFWWLEPFLPHINACCTVHDTGGSHGALLDCINAGLPEWAWGLAAVCIAVMVLVNPLYRRIKPWLNPIALKVQSLFKRRQ